MTPAWPSRLEVRDDPTPAPVPPTVAIGVGFDTARYGHHVTFLDHNLQPLCTPTDVAESHAGYQRLRQLFATVYQRFPTAEFLIRLDAAGQYATNLEAFLRQLPFPKSISLGDPLRNQNYRKAIFPKQKTDPAESFCAARFALRERPAAAIEVPQAIVQLREIVARLESQTLGKPHRRQRQKNHGPQPGPRPRRNSGHRGISHDNPQPPLDNGTRPTPGPSAAAADGQGIDFAALRAQVSMEQVLTHLGCFSQLHGVAPQKRGPCPVHGGQGPRQRSFSVHLGKNVFQCFHPPCAAKGNVLDLWAAVRRLPLHQAALDLARTFNLTLSARPGTKKRNP